jgi:hypothetical protein
MTAIGGNCATEPAAAAFDPVPSGPGIPNINPLTGLSTDYLNHFTEAVMVLEMVAGLPECLDDLRAWRPKTYTEHFATSRFANREAVIRAYEAADPAVRAALDEASATLNAVLVETRSVVLEHLATPAAGALAQRGLQWLKPLIARTAAVINGNKTKRPERTGSPQAAIDAIFAR